MPPLDTFQFHPGRLPTVCCRLSPEARLAIEWQTHPSPSLDVVLDLALSLVLIPHWLTIRHPVTDTATAKKPNDWPTINAHPSVIVVCCKHWRHSQRISGKQPTTVSPSYTRLRRLLFHPAPHPFFVSFSSSNLSGHRPTMRERNCPTFPSGILLSFLWERAISSRSSTIKPTTDHGEPKSSWTCFV